MSRGKLITFEGGEGAGKSSNIALAKALLEQAGQRCLVTREPGGTAVAEEIRRVLLQPSEEPMAVMTEMLLVFAARAQHLAQTILPAIEQGIWVLCDRFTDTTYAYQGYGRELGQAPVACLENLVQGDLRPDLTLLFDVSVDIGLARAGARGKPDRIESEQRAFFERIRSGFLALARQAPERWRVVDAGQPLEQVQAQVTRVLTDWLEDLRD